MRTELPLASAGDLHVRVELVVAGAPQDSVVRAELEMLCMVASTFLVGVGDLLAVRRGCGAGDLTELGASVVRNELEVLCMVSSTFLVGVGDLAVRRFCGAGDLPEHRGAGDCGAGDLLPVR